MKIRGVIFDMDGTITAPYLDFLALRARAGIPAGRDVLQSADYLIERLTEVLAIVDGGRRRTGRRR